MSSWFEVDRKGLAKLLERRGGKSWILAEVLQNAWDAPGATRVSLDLRPLPGRPLSELVVEDDSPEGFRDLAHAFTLFADSVKKSDPGLRGRFNFGEKLALSLCESAEITSTTGRVAFGPEGRVRSRHRREAGTQFRAVVRLNASEAREALSYVSSFIAPEGIETTVNGTALPPRTPLRSIEAVLATEVADGDGVLRRTRRKVPVAIHPVPEGGRARLYELGIPVMETGDAFDVDVGAKVPLGLERDSVSPSYLRDLRTAVLNATHDLIGSADANAPWLDDALADPDCAAEAARAVVSARFGEKVVSYDPSDREANALAVTRGYHVVHGGTFSAKQWRTIKEAGAILPAGRVTPSPKPFSPDGEPAERVDPTPSMDAFAAFVKAFAARVIGKDIEVVFLRRFNAAAAYGQRTMYFNVSRLGRQWFDRLDAPQIDLVMHELGHEYEANHLSMGFQAALTKIGAQATLLALKDPGLFDLPAYFPSAAPSP